MLVPPPNTALVPPVIVNTDDTVSVKFPEVIGFCLPLNVFQSVELKNPLVDVFA
jgi:hypothetical protein